MAAEAADGLPFRLVRPENLSLECLGSDGRIFADSYSQLHTNACRLPTNMSMCRLKIDIKFCWTHFCQGLDERRERKRQKKAAKKAAKAKVKEEQHRMRATVKFLRRLARQGGSGGLLNRSDPR